MKLTIRPVETADNIATARMIRRVFEEYDAPKTGTVYADPTTDALAELFQAPRSLLLVAEMNHAIMGCCGIFPTEGLPGDCAELVKFYLSHALRGKGVGRQLLQRCTDAARRAGYKRLYLESLPIFDKAVKMYEKQGFVRLNEPLGNSGHVACNIWMLKEL